MSPKERTVQTYFEGNRTEDNILEEFTLAR
jgi:hypothetical protein